MQKALVTEKGGRENSEDYCSYREADNFSCFVLADGLGGHYGGEVASKVIVETILDAFIQSPGFSAEFLYAYLEMARTAFLSAQKENSRLSGMKSTLVVLLTDHNMALGGHIGDSRLYFFRSGKLFFQTRDHSVTRHLVEIGDVEEGAIRFHEDRNRLTRAFDGVDLSRFDLSFEPHELVVGDAFLLCTDGFWEYVLEEEMIVDLQTTGEPAVWLDAMVKRLSKRANTGHDNYSAITIIN